MAKKSIEVLHMARLEETRQETKESYPIGDRTWNGVCVESY